MENFVVTLSEAQILNLHLLTGIVVYAVIFRS